MIRTDVLVIGSSLSALMTALNLRHRNPDLEVTVLGPLPSEEKRPMVGESLVEPGILFFREMGLGPYLEREQLIKHGLAFYHKLALHDPADRTYTMHAPKILHHKARQLRRPQFDEAIRARAIELGARFLHGLADKIDVGTGGALHRVEARVDGVDEVISARWLVDCSGRKRLVGTQVTRYQRPEVQRSTFWFRLKNFEPFLSHIDMQRRRDWEFDPWLTTHHFMGRGYWMWCIPLKAPELKNLCSMGFTYRPDLLGKRIRNLDELLAHVQGEHPAIADMIRSGEIVDTQMYFDYYYYAERLYSEDGWFLVGDTARTVDPLYSNGISMTTMQVGQVAEIIERQRAGTLRPGDVDVLDVVGRRMMERAQREVTDQYPVMHDPFQASIRRYLNVTGWFNGFLPLWWNGFFTTPEGARLLEGLFKVEDPMLTSIQALSAQVSARVGPTWRQADFDRGPDIDALLNLRFDCALPDLMRCVGLMFERRRYIRLRLLAMAGWGHLLGQLPHLARETLVPMGFRVVPLLNRAAFAAVRPPLPNQYNRPGGPEREADLP